MNTNVFPHVSANLNNKCIADKNEKHPVHENRITNANAHSVPRYLEKQQPKMLMYVIRNLKWVYDFDFIGGYVIQEVLKFNRVFCLNCGEIIGGGQTNTHWERNRNPPHRGRGCPIQRSIRNPTPCPTCGI